MQEKWFVDEDSVVRRIWGSGDTILLVFAGSAAEFALNKAVDWLYFTGRLPADPIGRLFSTVEYARRIVFSKNEAALQAIDSMASIHRHVEAERGMRIPDWAYRDVLFMLIDYSIRAHEVLENKLTDEEKEEVFQVFRKLGVRMGLNGLPDAYPEWVTMRSQHMEKNLAKSSYTDDLFRQYRKHLGAFRYRILLESQVLIAPARVKELLAFRRVSLLKPLMGLFKASRKIGADKYLKALLLPSDYKEAILELDVKPAFARPST